MSREEAKYRSTLIKEGHYVLMYASLDSKPVEAGFACAD